MAKTVVFESNSVTVWYDPESKMIYHEMHKFTYGEAFRGALTAGLEAMKKYHATKWLSDDRKNPVLGKEDTEWAQTQWYPAVKASGWKYWAIVQPEAVMAKVKMDEFAKTYAKDGITAKMFNNPADAVAWLASFK
jgi:hypothetical protein